jgi:hypothetical protein
VSGGIPGSASVRSRSSVSRSAAMGSVSSLGSPTGGVPVQVACPSDSVSAAALRAPTNDQRDQDSPCGADSSRKVPERRPASLR